MKKSELLQIFKEYLNTEVRKIIKEELLSIMSSVEPIEESKPRSQKQPKQVKFSGANAISSVLNETAMNYTPIEDDYETVDMGSFSPRGDIRAQFAQKLGLAPQTPTQPTVQEMLPDDKKHVQVPEELANILTRDYSQLVKTFNK